MSSKVYLVKTSFKNEDEVEVFSDVQMMKELIAIRLHSKRNIKERPLGGRKVIPDENLDLHEGMKSTGNVTTWVNI